MMKRAREDLRARALRVVFEHAPEHSLLPAEAWAPSRGWLAVQQRVRGPEIFEVFWSLTAENETVAASSRRCEALLRLSEKFFRGRSRDVCLGGKRYVLLENDDEPAPDCYVVVDRRTSPSNLYPATHVVSEHCASYSAPNSRLETVWCPAASWIEPQAFWHCMRLRIAVFPHAGSVGAYAFGGCSSLTALALPAALLVQDYAFFHCSSLTTLSLTAASILGDYACARCSKLRRVTLGTHAAVRPSTFLGGLGKLVVKRLPYCPHHIRPLIKDEALFLLPPG